MFSKMMDERRTVKYCFVNFSTTLRKFGIVFDWEHYGNWQIVEEYLIKYGKYPETEEFFSDSSAFDD